MNPRPRRTVIDLCGVPTVVDALDAGNGWLLVQTVYGDGSYGPCYWVRARDELEVAA